MYTEDLQIMFRFFGRRHKTLCSRLLKCKKVFNHTFNLLILVKDSGYKKRSAKRHVDKILRCLNCTSSKIESGKLSVIFSLKTYTVSELFYFHVAFMSSFRVL